MKKYSLLQFSRSALALLSIMTAGTIAQQTAQAGPEGKEPVVPVVDEPFGGAVHGLLNLEFSDHYITPRGLHVENQGLIFQPLLLLFWDLYSPKEGFLNDVTLTTGVWNSWHTRKSGATPRQWNEIDPIVGLTFKFAKVLTFDAFYTAFNSQTNSYDTSTNLDLKLTLDDSGYLGAFALRPYVEYFREIANKATVAFDTSRAPESYYFQFGITPGYDFKPFPVKVEFPTFISIVGDHFYQRFDGSGGGSGVGVFSTQAKFTTPLSFVPKRYGAWTLYAGVQYYHLNNPGLLDGNQVLGATTERKKDLWQLHGGISIFF